MTARPVCDAFQVRFARPEYVSAHDAEVIVTQRMAFADEERLNSLLRHRDVLRAKLIYDLDDDLTSLGPDHEEYALYHRRADYIQRIAHAADEVWVSTETLRQRMIRIGARASTIVNTLDPRIWRRPKLEPRRDALQVLLMGTNTHRRDFELVVAPAIRELRREFGEGIQLTVIGATNATSEDWGLSHPPSEVPASYPAFAHWLQTRHRPHIGLAPLTPSPFNNAKSRIKQLEYAALGATTIATSAGEYASSITPEIDGLLVDPRPEAFAHAVRSLLLDTDRLQRLREGAVRTAMAALAAGEAGTARLTSLRTLMVAERPPVTS